MLWKAQQAGGGIRLLAPADTVPSDTLPASRRARRALSPSVARHLPRSFRTRAPSRLACLPPLLLLLLLAPRLAPSPYGRYRTAPDDVYLPPSASMPSLRSGDFSRNTFGLAAGGELEADHRGAVLIGAVSSSGLRPPPA